MEIKTNNQWRHFVYGHELTDAERKEFDYIDAEELPTHYFIRYKGNVIDPSEFMQIDPTMLLHDENTGMEQWHGYQSDSYFSGLLIRYSDDGEEYQIATYYS